MEVGKIGNAGNKSTINTVKNKASDSLFETELQNAFDKNDEKQLKQACQEFESLFMNMMYKQMKATVVKSELIPQDSGRDIFESMLDDKMMEEASSGKGIGLSDVLYKQLSKQLKATYKPSNGNESKPETE